MGSPSAGEGPRIDKGLENIYVKETRICFVDGRTGRLLYRGYDIRDLADHSTFEETMYLLWHARLPNRAELAEFSAELGANRAIPAEIAAMIKKFPKTMVPIDALRTAVSALGAYDPELNVTSREANLRKGLRLGAKMPTLVAAFHRIRTGDRIVRPSPKYNTATDYLRMLTGKKPDKRTARIMDIALTLHADHSMNAGSFAATVAASTLPDLYSCVVAAIATLKGPLHGGANETALRALLEIESPPAAEEYVLKTLAAGKLVFGFGHRVYKTYDPRAIILQDIAKKLSVQTANEKVFQVAKAVEQTMVRELGPKGIYPNVDYYAGVVYYLLGLPPDLFPVTFAVSRISGWVAHILEYWEDNRIMRPLDLYIGPREAVYVPIDLR
ncbi:MAG TPA: citrate/2-methylcitrate synthase [Thermoplasmata archaeon]|nr:citrate/2-methylcitrate synthase [Thermoplasmata archaeon]